MEGWDEELTASSEPQNDHAQSAQLGAAPPPEALAQAFTTVEQMCKDRRAKPGEYDQDLTSAIETLLAHVREGQRTVDEIIEGDAKIADSYTRGIGGNAFAARQVIAERIRARKGTLLLAAPAAPLSGDAVEHARKCTRCLNGEECAIFDTLRVRSLHSAPRENGLRVSVLAALDSDGDWEERELKIRIALASASPHQTVEGEGTPAAKDE